MRKKSVLEDNADLRAITIQLGILVKSTVQTHKGVWREESDIWRTHPEMLAFITKLF